MGWIHLLGMYSVKFLPPLLIKVYCERRGLAPREASSFLLQDTPFLKGLAVQGKQTGSHKYCLPFKWRKICKEYPFHKERGLDFNVDYKMFMLIWSLQVHCFHVTK